MKEIDFSVSLEDVIDGNVMLQRIERFGRVCYKSEDKATDGSAREFVRKILTNKHESVLEHEKITLRVICDRGVTHELVRHRIGSYSQESTRYCNYSQSKYGREITCIRPGFWSEDDVKMKIWRDSMTEAESRYFELLDSGATPQEARSVLPNSLKTEIIVTYNLREWRHFLRLRTAAGAHPQMKEVAFEIHRILKEAVPVVFDTI